MVKGVDNDKFGNDKFGNAKFGNEYLISSQEWQFGNANLVKINLTNLKKNLSRSAQHPSLI